MIETKYIEIEHIKLFVKQLIVQENKTNPTLIFLHDSWGCTEMWEDFPEKLVKMSGLNALIYDRQGHGKSSPFGKTQRNKSYLHKEAEVLIQLMDTLKIREAVLYGHSDGATISLIAAALYPERITGLILESVHSFMEEEGKIAVRESRDKAKHNSLLKSLTKFHGDKTNELFRRWHETWLADFFADWTIVPLLKNITCPILAFRGENDPYDTIAQMDILRNEIKSDKNLAIISHASHTPRKENEAESMKLMRDFLFPTYNHF